SSRQRSSLLNSNLFEVDLLAYRAVRAAPFVGHLGPRGACRKPFAGFTFGLVVDVIAAGATEGGHALPPCSSRERSSAAFFSSRERSSAAAPYRASTLSRTLGWMLTWVMSPP